MRLPTERMTFRVNDGDERPMPSNGVIPGPGLVRVYLDGKEIAWTGIGDGEVDFSELTLGH